jgi:predicted nucleic acid-binding protein
MVFEDVVTPSAVIDELDRAAASDYEFTEGIDAVKAYDGGWLEVVTPTEDERQRADELRDHALSRTDAHCIAITDGRDWRLLTDDVHGLTSSCRPISRLRGPGSSGGSTCAYSKLPRSNRPMSSTLVPNTT